MNTGSLILRPSPWTTHLFTYVLDMSSKLLQGDPSLNQDLPLLCKPVQGQRICPDQVGQVVLSILHASNPHSHGDPTAHAITAQQQATR
jgi:hypothetical protein